MAVSSKAVTADLMDENGLASRRIPLFAGFSIGLAGDVSKKERGYSSGNYRKANYSPILAGYIVFTKMAVRLSN